MTEEKKVEESEQKTQSLKDQAAQQQEIPKQEPVTSDQTKSDQIPVKEEDPNWRAFREARKRDRLEKEAAERRAREKEEEAAALKAAMEAAFARQQQAPQQPPNYYNYGGPQENYEQTDDQKIERLVNQAIEKKQSEFARQQQEREKVEMPSRLRQTFSDFNETVTPENLDYLEYHYPEIAKPLGRLQESYEKWEDIYKAVKRFVPNSVNSHREAARADHNQNKPRSISSTQITNTENTVSSHKLSEQRRNDNWRRMQRVLKGLE